MGFRWLSPVGRQRLFLICCLSLLFLLVSSGCDLSSPDVAPTFAPPPTTGPGPGDTFTVERGDIGETLEARGRVEGRQEALLVFPLEGALKEIHVSPGDQVEEGDLLAELDAPRAREKALEAQYDVARAEAELEQARLHLAQAQASGGVTGAISGTVSTVASLSTWPEGPYTVTLPLQTGLAPEVALAQINVERAEEALRQASIEWDKAVHRPWEPPEVRKHYTQTLQARKRDYRAARAQLRQAQQSVRDRLARLKLEVEAAKVEVGRTRALEVLASEQLSSTMLTAPFSGLIISLEKQPGDWLRAYEAVGAMADPSELQVVATVLEENVNRVIRGQSTTVHLDAYPEEEYTGTVVQIASEPTIWQGKNAYQVTIAFEENQDVPATIQMGADVIFAGRSEEDVLLIPTQAIMSIGGQKVVEIVDDDGDVERVAVETGLSDGSKTEVVSGLEEGQTVRIP